MKTAHIHAMSAGGFPPADASKSRVAHGENHAAFAWPEPVLFDDQPTPDIPATLLPGCLGEYAAEVSRFTQTPPAMAVMMGLSVTATCAAKRFDVSPWDGYHEPLCLWTATVMPPASRKSSVTSHMTAPLVEWEIQAKKRLEPEMKIAVGTRKALEHQLEKLEKQAGNANDAQRRTELIQQAVELQSQMPDIVRYPLLWTGDTTPERLQHLLEEHGERMAVLADEGGIFETMAGLYTGGNANNNVFLQGHSGNPVRVDRQNRTAQLHSPALTFGLTIQPAIIQDFANGSKRKFRGNGTLARFLYAIPVSNIGYRDTSQQGMIDPAIQARYKSMVFDLLSVPSRTFDGIETPRTLKLSPEALKVRKDFADKIEIRQRMDGDLESIQDWSGKLPGAALRIAGLFHLVTHGPTFMTPIDADTMSRATALCELLIDHAKHVFGLLDTDQTTDDAKAAFRWIMDQDKARFTRNDFLRQFKGRFTGKQERMNKTLAELEALSIILGAKEQTSGRPASVYTVNPHLWHKGDQ